MTDFNELQRRAWEIAEDKGFHERDCCTGHNEACDKCGGEVDLRNRPKILSLIHSEVSEALEADREYNDELYAEELADIVIRVMDHAESEDIHLDYEIRKKMRKNEERDHKHGKRY